MADESRIECYYDKASGKQGISFESPGVIVLNAPEVLLSPETPLLTKSQDLAGAINEIWKKRHGNK